MQKKNSGFYTIHLPQFLKSKNKAKRVEISKKFVHLFAIVLLAAVGTASVIFIRHASLAESKTEAIVLPATVQSTAKAEYKAISYDRPAESEMDIDISYESAVAAGYSQDAAAGGGAVNTQLDAQVQTVVKSSAADFLPTMWAHYGKITNEFGFRRNPFGGFSYEFHAGMDIGGDTGDPIIAPANGVVRRAEWAGGYGNLIELDHGNGLTTRYGHLSRIGVAAGTNVTRGQFMGFVGSTGRSTGAHLHFEVRFNGRPINPRRFLTAPPTLAQMQAR